MIEVKKVKRKGVDSWIFSFEVSKKKFVCEHTYKTERSAITAGNNFIKRYIKES